MAQYLEYEKYSANKEFWKIIFVFLKLRKKKKKSGMAELQIVDNVFSSMCTFLVKFNVMIIILRAHYISIHIA